MMSDPGRSARSLLGILLGMGCLLAEGCVRQPDAGVDETEKFQISEQLFDQALASSGKRDRPINIW
jgi:hypothetical protein